MLRVATAARRLLPPGNPRLRHLTLASFSTAAPPPAEPPQRFPLGSPPPPPPSVPPTLQEEPKATAAASPGPEPSPGSAETAEDEVAGLRLSPSKGGDYDDQHALILRAALRHVKKRGWSESALIAGVGDVGLSASIVASFPSKEAALIEFFMDDCLEKLMGRIDSGELDLSNLILSERLSKLIRVRLEMQMPYISKWAQALSIQAQPMNIPASLKQRIMLVDEIWRASGDEVSDIGWYVKRTILSGIYSASEVYMLTDNSPEFRDTWTFLDNRIKDAFDIQKTAQEAAYVAEAVGSGVGSSMQGFMRGLFKGFRL